MTGNLFQTIAEGILSPKPAPAIIDALAPHLDNVAWHDFADYRCVVSPEYEVQPPPVVSSPPTLSELGLYQERFSKTSYTIVLLLVTSLTLPAAAQTFDYCKRTWGPF